jgi:CheY-like chemotaxis protein/HPt (histidine-containing phosphotransfer) domain-containing protein
VSIGQGGSKPISDGGGPGPGGTRLARPRTGRVLIAEDNAANRKLALAMLHRLGYSADAAASGLEAIEAVHKLRYDAVLMDCRMPEMDGFQATAEIRRRETSPPRIPIIAMTADAMEGDRQRCLDAGMDDYLSKPVSFESLAAVLDRWLSPADPRPNPTSPAALSTTEGRRVGSEEPLDPAIIAGLRRLGKGRGEQWMPQLISEFLRDAGSNLDRLRLAVEQEDLRTIADRSHALAGSVATFGARGMGQLCRRLKTLGSQGNLEAARETMAEIEAEFDRVLVALRAEFPDSEGKDT